MHLPINNINDLKFKSPNLKGMICRGFYIHLSISYYESIETVFEHSIIKVAAACSGVTLYSDYHY